MKLHVAIEYNWKRVGGIFSSKELCEKWCNKIARKEPNLLWEPHLFTLNIPITVEEAVQDAKGIRSCT
jgi:hypothetical protein